MHSSGGEGGEREGEKNFTEKENYFETVNYF
jgi:hypothetical protein